jgi:hypothetical protein
MKTGKELKLPKFKDYNVVYGSVNNKTPKAIYVNISAWAEPILNDDNINYNRSIKDLHKKIKQYLYNYFNQIAEEDFVKENTIVDLDIRESGIKFGKRSFMSCEITFYLKVEIAANSEHMQKKLEEISKKIVKDVFNENKNFKFHKKKN